MGIGLKTHLEGVEDMEEDDNDAADEDNLGK
jgi:hypothetical protein